MSQYGWVNCPKPIRDQVKGFLDALREVLGENLVGVYLHGSLALGCFNVESSDVDLLVVTRRGMTPETKRRIAELLLRCSAAPRPIEISFLAEHHLDPWEHPTPFDFHYGEEWREKYEKHLSSREWKKLNEMPERDPDLAGHITVTLRRGIVLYGKPIAEVFPAVPEEHYIASIVSDFEWGRERMAQYPRNFILNTCRVYVYLVKGDICSKKEAGAWALDALPEEFQEIVAQALGVYRGNRGDESFEGVALERFARHMGGQLKALLIDRDMHTAASLLGGR